MGSINSFIIKWMKKLTLTLTALLIALNAHAAIEFTVNKDTGAWTFTTDESIQLTTDSTDTIASWTNTAGGINEANFTWTDGGSSGTGNVSFLVDIPTHTTIETFELRLYSTSTTLVSSSFVVTPSEDFSSDLSALVLGPSLAASDPSGNNFLTYSIVPESSNMALMLGIVALGFRKLIRRKRA